MSIAQMTLAWKADLPSGRKMVMLALCDNANDQGECFPSIPMLAKKCSMGERTVQDHISTLEAEGYVTREMRRGQSTIYRVNPAHVPPQNLHQCEIRTPQISHPTPADFAPPPPQISHPTPAKSAPITINEPSGEPKKKKTTKVADAPLAGLPDWVPVTEWTEYVEMRKRIKAPLTDHAKRLELGALEKLRGEGHDPVAVLNRSIQKSWRGLFPLKDLPRAGPQRPSTQSGFEKLDYGKGIDENGRF